ncbi:MAG: lipid-A-disaccharide synthase [Bacteroidetes bacterium]|nr:lipid-A-disaccharide synthase [Bacteroidota bacterium]
MRYYIIAGEASGDLHGSNLIKALRAKDPDAEIKAWGGDKMEAAGATLVKHIRDLAFMGFVEVLKHLGTILDNISFCKTDILQYKPDVIIFIDYPGFNMRIAEWARKQGFKTVYYISPTVWAWKENRVKKIKRDVDLMMVILPFEVDFYKSRWQHDVVYVGHPLIEVIEREKEVPPVSLNTSKPVIAVLPGSRKQEILTKLPVMMQMVQHFPQYTFVVAKAPSLPDELYTSIIGDKDVLLVKNQTYNVLKQAEAALVTSGTATLETALFGVPQVVCYKAEPISFWIAKRIVRVKYISLVNLIMDKPVVTELIQGDLNEQNLKNELEKLLTDGPGLQSMKKDYAELWTKLGSRNASTEAAGAIMGLLN